MPSYKRLKIGELRQYCMERGLNSDGLKKKQLIEILQDYDLQEANEALFNDETEEIDNDDLELPENDDEIENEEEDEEELEQDVEYNEAQENGATGSAQNAELTALKLKMKLLQMERKHRLELLAAERENEQHKLDIERQRVEIARNAVAQPTSANAPANPIGEGAPCSTNLQVRVPSMPTSTGQVLAWFQAFEKALSVQGIDQTLWAKILPQYLTGHALITYSKLTLEQSQIYSETKKEILKGYKLTPYKYLQKLKAMKRTGNESYTQFLERLKQAQKHYLESKSICTFQQLLTDNLYVQMSDSLPGNVKRFW